MQLSVRLQNLRCCIVFQLIFDVSRFEPHSNRLCTCASVCTMCMGHSYHVCTACSINCGSFGTSRLEQILGLCNCRSLMADTCCSSEDYTGLCCQAAGGSVCQCAARAGCTVHGSHSRYSTTLQLCYKLQTVLVAGHVWVFLSYAHAHWWIKLNVDNVEAASHRCVVIQGLSGQRRMSRLRSCRPLPLTPWQWYYKQRKEGIICLLKGKQQLESSSML